MTFIFLILSLTAVVAYILWILFKPKKQRPQKITELKKKPALKKKVRAQKQKKLDSISDEISRKKAEQIKKDPKIISHVLRIWLNEK